MREQARFEARTQELQSAQAELKQQVKGLTESLVEETEHRGSV
jgi:hypothetical protein